MARTIAFVERFREDVRTLLTDLDRLRGDIAHYDALGLDATIQDSDVPSGQGLTAADVKAAIARARQVLGVQLVDLFKMRD